jgi:uncharacterized membrane protein (UPF0127 family)
MREFSKGDHVQLGSGSEGIVVDKVSRNSFEGYKVRVTKSVDSDQVGNIVGATPDGMTKMSKCLKIGNLLVECKVAETEEQQKEGLQVYAGLEDGEGLLFPYNPPQTVAFHMGSVSFPIDMVGIHEGKVAELVENIQPGTPGNWIFQKVEAVLEVPGGFCKKYAIEQGTDVSEVEAQGHSFDPLRTITEASGDKSSFYDWERYLSDVRSVASEFGLEVQEGGSGAFVSSNDQSILESMKKKIDNTPGLKGKITFSSLNGYKLEVLRDYGYTGSRVSQLSLKLGDIVKFIGNSEGGFTTGKEYKVLGATEESVALVEPMYGYTMTFPLSFVEKKAKKQGQQVPSTIDLDYSQDTVIKNETDARAYLSRSFGIGISTPRDTAADILDAYEYRNQDKLPSEGQLSGLLMQPDYRMIWLQPLDEANRSDLLPAYNRHPDYYQNAYSSMVLSELPKELKERESIYQKYSRKKVALSYGDECEVLIEGQKVKCGVFEVVDRGEWDSYRVVVHGDYPELNLKDGTRLEVEEENGILIESGRIAQKDPNPVFSTDRVLELIDDTFGGEPLSFQMSSLCAVIRSRSDWTMDEIDAEIRKAGLSNHEIIELRKELIWDADKRAQVSNPQYDDNPEPILEPGQDLPKQKPPAPAKNKTKNRFQNRETPENIAPDSKDQYQSFGYSPLEETDVAIRPSARMKKMAQVILQVHPQLVNEIIREWKEFQESPVGRASSQLAVCYEEKKASTDIEKAWKNLTAGMTVWDVDAIVHGLVSAGYDNAIDLLKVSRVAQFQDKDFEVGQQVKLQPRQGDAFEGIRQGEVGEIKALQGSDLIQVKFEDYPIAKWLDPLDLQALPPEQPEGLAGLFGSKKVAAGEGGKIKVKRKDTGWTGWVSPETYQKNKGDYDTVKEGPKAPEQKSKEPSSAPSTFNPGDKVFVLEPDDFGNEHKVNLEVMDVYKDEKGEEWASLNDSRGNVIDTPLSSVMKREKKAPKQPEEQPKSYSAPTPGALKSDIDSIRNVVSGIEDFQDKGFMQFSLESLDKAYKGYTRSQDEKSLKKMDKAIDYSISQAGRMKGSEKDFLISQLQRMKNSITEGPKTPGENLKPSQAPSTPTSTVLEGPKTLQSKMEKYTESLSSDWSKKREKLLKNENLKQEVDRLDEAFSEFKKNKNDETLGELGTALEDLEQEAAVWAPNVSLDNMTEKVDKMYDILDFEDEEPGQKGPKKVLKNSTPAKEEAFQAADKFGYEVYVDRGDAPLMLHLPGKSSFVKVQDDGSWELRNSKYPEKATEIKSGTNISELENALNEKHFSEISYK